MAGRFRSLLSQRPGLIVSLPRNDAELARAAWEHGADALKVHLNVRHAAAGTGFGPWADEQRALTPIFEDSPVPVGVMPGAEQTVSPDDLHALLALGVDFVDAYAHHLPAWMLAEPVDRLLAVDASYDDAAVRALPARAHLLEAAIVPHAHYGRPFAPEELPRLRALHDLSGLPVVVPTQRALTPGDARRLVSDAGVSALMIGIIVMGDTPHSVAAAATRFRAALEA